MRISKEFHFDAAHHLPLVPIGHPCGRVHGHTYRIVIWLEGDPDLDTGWICDYSEIARAWAPLANALDHRDLNEIDGLENPTTEVLIRWCWVRLEPALPLLARLQIFESSTTCCEYDGEI